MNIEEVRKIVSGIRTSLFKNSSAYAIGMLKSHFRGTGLRFKEHQVYVHGDDVRFIDWKVLAKTSSPYIKTFEEDRNVEIVAILDASPTMLTGWKGVSKLQAAMEICCLLYLLAKETGDKVHAIVISDEILDIPLASGEEGIIALVSILRSRGLLNMSGHVNIGFEYKSKVEIENKLSAIMKHLKKRREVVLLSDFHDFIDIKLLRKLLYKSNIHGFRLESPLDRSHRVPFSFFVRTHLTANRGGLKRIDSKEMELLDKTMGKKLKKLKVDGRYLEDFVKEML